MNEMSSCRMNVFQNFYINDGKNVERSEKRLIRTVFLIEDIRHDGLTLPPLIYLHIGG